MHTTTRTNTEVRAILADLRHIRFEHGIHCPHCGSDIVRGWGWFGARRRYRCGKCLRTFSDLTGTAMAYCKRLHLLPRYLECMQESRTIRDSAKRLNVHTTTTFRWRHRILGAVLQADANTLESVVEVASTTFPYSEKGQRKTTHQPRTRGYRPFDPRLVTAPQVAALVACDVQGTTISAVLRTRQPYDHDVRERIMTRVQGRAVVMAYASPISPYGRAAQAVGHEYVEIPRFAPQVDLPDALGSGSPAQSRTAPPDLARTPSVAPLAAASGGDTTRPTSASRAGPASPTSLAGAGSHIRAEPASGVEPASGAEPGPGTESEPGASPSPAALPPGAAPHSAAPSPNVLLPGTATDSAALPPAAWPPGAVTESAESVPGAAALPPGARVRSSIGRIHAWLPRFCGVATRYLQHYLIWRHALDAGAAWVDIACFGILRRPATFRCSLKPE